MTHLLNCWSETMYWSREHRIQLLITTQHPLEMNRISFCFLYYCKQDLKAPKFMVFSKLHSVSHVNRGGYSCIPYRVIYFSESMFLIVKEALLGLGKPYKTSVKQIKLPLVHLTCGRVVVCKHCSNAPSYSLAFVFVLQKLLQCLLVKPLLLCLFFQNCSNASS
jgi:hypothetical protein